jgi:hypothetical protein
MLSQGSSTWLMQDLYKKPDATDKELALSAMADLMAKAAEELRKAHVMKSSIKAHVMKYSMQSPYIYIYIYIYMYKHTLTHILISTLLTADCILISLTS